MSVHSDDPLPDILAEAGVPLVLCGRPFDDREVAFVDADNRGGAAVAIEHLVGTGRRRIATVTGPLDMIAGVDRYAGYREALVAAGHEVRPELVAEGDFTEAGGQRAMEQLLARVPDLDAVFVASDPMAVGALRALRAAGRRVPEDVAVVGFDDSPLSRVTDPPLSTVRQPVDEMGREMAEMLLRLISGADGDVQQSAVLPTELVVRASS